jgi:TET-Associated Glycosyltransferase
VPTGDHGRFAVFVLTHGRPDNVITTASLRKAGYTGRVVYVIDNEDDRADEYRSTFGADNVIMFDKAAVAQTFDTADTQEDRRSIVYARNASAQIARDLGLHYFLQLDDDYTSFRYRWYEDGKAPTTFMRTTMDDVVEAMLTFLDDTGAATVALSQGGDHLSGNYRELRLGLLRKAMNSFFCRTDRPVQFLGRINEDVNTYVTLGSRGELFLTVMSLQLDQSRTQASTGGMTDVYLTSGTYVKSFYTVMMAPSCVSVRMMRTKHRRYHHMIRWDHAVPKILSPKYRKA